ncbi:MAG: hypothetical protein LBU32_28015 [Clostridiales bacterium]|jgi:hypothetical protein|nr:hypothetical protein [Clostridiales bacterium]
MQISLYPYDGGKSWRGFGSQEISIPQNHSGAALKGCLAASIPFRQEGTPAA